MLTSSEIRQNFFDFFKSKEHEIVPSAPIVIKNDPTLLFTNAGMNQFKDNFLGNAVPNFSRVADTQKCLRVSGKHNDLEEVGVDTYHHTMFEMLGNWSFGNSTKAPAPYFKKEAIAYAWELLTKIYKIPEESIYVTVFEGDETEGLSMDMESFAFWKEWISEDRILTGNKKDNFWEMGDTGPCGPCTEIHIDCRSPQEKLQQNGRLLVNNDHPQVIEIWNLVFIQFNRKKDGSLEELSARHVDTGMGFERLVRVLQQKASNYDTDVFSGSIKKIEELSGKKYTGTNSMEDISFRVIADHIRAIAFAITDGQLPSNTGAGYVIRRILRRAVRYYFSYLEMKSPLLYQLADVLAVQFQNVFPGLYEQADFVSKVIQEEEYNFLRTLDSGLKRLQSILGENKTIDGKTAFELYDTYGFPLDLTNLIASEHKLSVDEAGFEQEMKQQKDRSRAATAIDAGDWITVHGNGSPRFNGYQHTKTTTRILRYRKTKSQGKEYFQLVLENTPFYAESGGQVGDTGILDFDGEKIEVFNTKKENDLILHFVKSLPAAIEASLDAKIDTAKRRRIMAHHTATHLLHAALRRVLGTHVMQKGSLVNEEELRFDFSHFSKVTAEDISRIEEIVNAKIRENVAVTIQEMPKEEAIESGAMAIFGEKYENMVRVVTMDPQFSVELCGGTHVARTGDLGVFKITSESAVGAGIRRMTAVSGEAAWSYISEEQKVLGQIREAFKNPKDLWKSVDNLLQENSRLKKQLEQEEAKGLVVLSRQLREKSEKIADKEFLGAVVEVASADALKKLAILLKDELKSHVIVLAANVSGKAAVAVAVDENTAKNGLKAPEIIKKHVAPLIKGGGGGQPTLATAGGQETGSLTQVIAGVKAAITNGVD